VKDRQFAWTDPEVRELVEKHFIPAADQVDKLQFGNNPASKFFQSIAQRSFTRLRTTQGTYIVSPGGVRIDFGNVIAPEQMNSFLLNGIKEFEALPTSRQLGKPRTDDALKSSYPKEGLVLSVTLRKLYSRQPRTPREKIGIVEWNADFAWFRKHEARQFLPVKPKPGDKHTVPEKLIERLARFHFTDTVRAFADVYPQRCVKEAKLTTTVVDVTGKLVSVRFDGRVRTSQDDARSFGRLRRNPDRGYDAKLLGYAKFDLAKQRFVSFDLVAFGTNRDGGIRANFEDPVKMGVMLQLAKTGPAYRVEPNHFSKYGW
jgi:hypothetical protein